MEDFFSRYADRISVGGPGDCWIWRGAVAASGGYGHTHRHNKHVYAHRAAYESVHGIGSADGLVVRHRCDNPPCCNPAHLDVGTHADNARDKIERGRANCARGERSPKARLTEAQVLRGRQLAKEGWPIARIVEVIPCRHTAMGNAVRGITWSHLPGAVAEVKKASPPGSPHGRGHVLTTEMARKIHARLATGEVARSIAADFGIARSTVAAIKSGRIWSHAAS